MREIHDPVSSMEDSIRAVLSADLKRRRLQSESPAPPLPASPPPPAGLSDSIRSPAIAGWSIIGIFFGIFGGWALIAPLHGAVVANNAVVKVEGNRKSVQHLEGGIIKELRVKDGDRVAAGDILILLDDSQARAEFDVLSQQYLVLRATEERLKAELSRAPELIMPDDFKARLTDPSIAGIWKGQVYQFESRATAQRGSRCFAPPPSRESLRR
jgi:epimerase transport system membrane fusion protein